MHTSSRFLSERVACVRSACGPRRLGHRPMPPVAHSTRRLNGKRPAPLVMVKHVSHSLAASRPIFVLRIFFLFSRWSMHATTMWRDSSVHVHSTSSVYRTLTVRKMVERPLRCFDFVDTECRKTFTTGCEATHVLGSSDKRQVLCNIRSKHYYRYHLR